MKNLEIRSKKLGKTFEFTRRGDYVYLDNDQICYGGGFRGSTVMVFSDDEFVKKCRAWYRAYIRDAVILDGIY